MLIVEAEINGVIKESRILFLKIRNKINKKMDGKIVHKET